MFEPKQMHVWSLIKKVSGVYDHSSGDRGQSTKCLGSDRYTISLVGKGRPSIDMILSNFGVISFLVSGAKPSILQNPKEGQEFTMDRGM